MFVILSLCLQVKIAEISSLHFSTLILLVGSCDL